MYVTKKKIQNPGRGFQKRQFLASLNCSGTSPDSTYVGAFVCQPAKILLPRICRVGFRVMFGVMFRVVTWSRRFGYNSTGRRRGGRRETRMSSQQNFDASWIVPIDRKQPAQTNMTIFVQ